MKLVGASRARVRARNVVLERCVVPLRLLCELMLLVREESPIT